MMATLVLILGYVVAVFGGTMFVEWALDRVLSVRDRELVDAFCASGLEQGEKVVGWLERFLIMTFVLSDSHTVIGLVLAVKVLARYGAIREPDGKPIADYVLIGTMLSLSWALIVSIVVLNVTS